MRFGTRQDENTTVCRFKHKAAGGKPKKFKVHKLINQAAGARVVVLVVAAASVGEGVTNLMTGVGACGAHAKHKNSRSRNVVVSR